jgi:mannosyltransferase OCH1-like enzyme
MISPGDAQPCGIQYRSEVPADHSCAPIARLPGQKKVPVPHRFFQTWKNHSLPDNFARWSATWRQLHPDWEYELWDDAQNRAFIAEHYPWFLRFYDAYPAEIYRADAVRYFYLFHFGGVYVDLDFECKKPITPLLEQGGVVLGRMLLNPHPEGIPNAFMASPPRASFWQVVAFCLMNTPPTANRPEARTGPALLRTALREYKQPAARRRITRQLEAFMGPADEVALELRPPCELYPLDWTTGVYTQVPCNYAVTYWTHSW